ncbi:MAG TPA: MBOAT family O-acyltransferase [Bacteroidia bacterium]|nr:MBOAT family O-acyltransferase [Bacteroidia bacterium]
MVFSSTIFLFWFLPLCLFVYFIIQNNYKNGVLLFFSLLFYAWGGFEMLAIVLFSILTNYIVGISIQQANNKTRSKQYLFLGIVINLLILLYYKYANFFLENYNIALTHFGREAIVFEKIILPLGISFYTFHGISYIIDVYRKDSIAQKNPFDLALYFSFFPQLIAGPIVRYKDIQSQLKERTINSTLFVEGIKRFILGLGKKVLIANIIGRIPDQVFALPENELNAYWSWLAIIAATVQVYLDFSGYSDMAIGLAKMFGFQFKENFNYPFIAKSMKDFWTRWHISLSSWFRDYVYIPLGGNRKGTIVAYLNIAIVFLLTGFWHGASWSYVLFGAFHGTLVIIEKIGFNKLIDKLPSVLSNVYVFFTVAFGIIFFSIDNLQNITSFYKSLFHFQAPNIHHPINLYLTNEWYITLILGLLFCFPVVEYVFGKIKNYTLKKSIEAILLISVFILSIAELANTSYNPFIYFRF